MHLIMNELLIWLQDPTVLAIGMIATAAVTLPVLLFGPTAPYGR